MKDYDPSCPVTIYNPYPAHLWPHKEGDRVYYLTNFMRLDVRVATGRVRFYNPALEQTFLVTRGRPCVTVDVVAGDVGTVQIVPLDRVVPFTRAGLAALKRRLAQMEPASPRPSVSRANYRLAPDTPAPKLRKSRTPAAI
jgi:hypothetical protein